METISGMIPISKIEDFNKRVRNAEGLQITRFCANWSGPCHIMGPIFKELSLAYANRAAFYEIDIEKSPQLQSELGIIEIPTILFYRNGELIDLIPGLISREALIEKLENGIKSV